MVVISGLERLPVITTVPINIKTTLGNNVFIGSNSTLVAPIEIADDGFVWLGRFQPLLRNIPSKSLAIARGKTKKNIEGWSRPTKSVKG